MTNVFISLVGWLSIVQKKKNNNNKENHKNKEQTDKCKSNSQKQDATQLQAPPQHQK